MSMTCYMLPVLLLWLGTVYTAGTAGMTACSSLNTDAAEVTIAAYGKLMLSTEIATIGHTDHGSA